MMNDMGGFGWFPGFGWIFMLLLWGLVILGILAILKLLATGRDSGKAPSPRSDLDILEERYARGEIDRDRFEQEKRDLAR